MHTNIKFTDTDHDNELREYVEQKIAAFNKLLSPAQADAAICDVELSRSTHHQNGDVFRAEVTLEVEGRIYRVSKEEPNHRKAIDKVKDDILATLRSDKEKNRDTKKRGAAAVKEWLHRG